MNGNGPRAVWGSHFVHINEEINDPFDSGRSKNHFVPFSYCVGMHKIGYRALGGVSFFKERIDRRTSISFACT